MSAWWKKIGRALRLETNVLERIQAANPEDPEECLSQAIVQWLRRNYDVEKFGQPTWKCLVEVVAHPAGGSNRDLAIKIAQTYRGPVALEGRGRE